MKDFLGKEFCAGQTIVYPVRVSSWMSMHKAIITHVGEDYLKATYYRRPWRKDEIVTTHPVKIWRTDRVIIVAD